MEVHRVAIRALFVYFFLLGLMRLSGKRTVAEGTTFSFVFALVLGDLIDDALWAEVPLAQFVVAAGTLGVLQLLVSWSTARSDWFDRLVSGPPTEVIIDGRPQRRGLRRERMSDKQLAFEARHHGLAEDRLEEIASGHVEASGALSVLRAQWARTVPRRDAARLRERVRR